MTDFTKSRGGILMPAVAMRVGGIWSVDHIRDNRIIDHEDVPNMVVDEGLDSLLNVYMHGDTQITTWYIGIFEGNYTPVSTVTAATITSASTECTAYDETTRQEFVEAAASSQSITNSASVATFTFNATKTIYGAFLVSASAKSATSGTLFSAARFAASKSVVSTDQLNLTYTFTAASA